LGDLRRRTGTPSKKIGRRKMAPFYTKTGVVTGKEDKRMNRVMETKKTIGLVALVVAMLMVLTAALAAPDAEAKKKKKKKLNKIECVQQGTVCNGTSRNDLLVGSSAFEVLRGGEGNDVYDGKNGEDDWIDLSETSNDTYKAGPALEASRASGKFEPWSVVDFGGSDTIDFAPFSSDDIVEVTDDAFGGNLGIRVLLNEDPRRTGAVIIPGHLEEEENRIENFKFSDRTLTAEEIEAQIPQV
jgi:hypothetical protein